MNDKYELIKKLILNFDLNKINIELITENSKLLYKYYNQLKYLYNINLNYTYEEYNIDEIKNKIKTCFLYKNKTFNKYLDETNKCILLKSDTVNFFCIYKNNVNNKLLNKLFKISNILHKFSKNKSNIEIIWVPIDKKRNFNFDNIKKYETNDFEAFCASGVTMGNLSIITRIEEIQKLLLHELIHNLNLDGSKFHDDFKYVIKNYNTNNNYKYEYSIYESYTELLSSYFNIIFNLLYKNDNNDILNQIISSIVIEYIYSINVINNLLFINSYTSYQEFIDNGMYFKGNISIFEYYYLKCLMYNKFNLIELYTKSDFKNNLIKIIEMDKNDYNINMDNIIIDVNYRYIYFTPFDIQED